MNDRRHAYNTEEIRDPASQFDEIAFLYDELMSGVPYRAWVNYVQRILEHFGSRPETVLDLCCGTGQVSIMLARQGLAVAGVDISPQMVERARFNARKQRVSVDFRVQDAVSLRLGRRFDLVISLFDSLNYILDASSLQQTLYRVAEHMSPGGLFIFDVNTELALAAGLFNQNNMGSRSSVIYDWKSSYDPASRICRIRMYFTYRRRNTDRKVEVTHYQRAYDLEEIEDMLKSAGLEILAVYDAYTFRKAGGGSDRAFFVARRQKDMGITDGPGQSPDRKAPPEAEVSDVSDQLDV